MMNSLPRRVQNKAKELRKRGLSHRDIARKLNIGLGSAFKYTKEIKITRAQHLALMRRSVNKLTPQQRRLGGLNAPLKFKPQYTKRELLKKIIDFYNRNGRIPLKREIPHYRAYLRLFGTWNNAIREAGFKPNPVLFAKKFKANDGHICDSLAEKIIDDWLYAREIPHSINVPYPENGVFTADFVTGDVWIEFFGLSGEHKRYDELKEKKLKLAKQHNLKLIKIYPKDLFPKNKLVDLLEFLLDNKPKR